jgi:hypothetical protein
MSRVASVFSRFGWGAFSLAALASGVACTGDAAAPAGAGAGGGGAATTMASDSGGGGGAGGAEPSGQWYREGYVGLGVGSHWTILSGGFHVLDYWGTLPPSTCVDRLVGSCKRRECEGQPGPPPAGYREELRYATAGAIDVAASNGFAAQLVEPTASYLEANQGNYENVSADQALWGSGICSRCARMAPRCLRSSSR